MNSSIQSMILKNLLINWREKNFFIKLKHDYLDDEEINRTKQITKLFNNKSGEELTQLFLKSDVLLLACVFEKFLKVSVNEFVNIHLYCVSLPSYTW